MTTFVGTRLQQGVTGNLKYEVWDLSHVQTNSSSAIVVGMHRPLIAIPQANGTASSLINVVSISGQTITLDGSADLSGQLIVLGQ